MWSTAVLEVVWLLLSLRELRKCLPQGPASPLPAGLLPGLRQDWKETLCPTSVCGSQELVAIWTSTSGVRDKSNVVDAHLRILSVVSNWARPENHSRRWKE